MIQEAIRSNASKYANPNPLHQWLLRRFLDAVVSEASRALAPLDKPALLDVGCGEGYVLQQLEASLPLLGMHGLDGDRKALEVATATSPRTLFLQGDAGRLPFKDSSFDLVSCLEVLEHLQEPWQALDEAARVSREYVLVSVPNQPYFGLTNLLRGKNLRRLGEDPGHIHHWTASQFLGLVRRNLRVVSQRYPFPWVLVLAETCGGDS